MLRFFLWSLVVLFLVQPVLGQQEQLAPTGDLSTPREAAYQHIHYLDDDDMKSYKPKKAARSLVGKGKKITSKDIELAKKLKQIYDGRGLIVAIENIPDYPEYVDSVSGNPVYKPFPSEFPTIYIERPIIGKRRGKRVYAKYWRYSARSVEDIPSLHKQVYPLGSHLLLEWLPQGGTKFLGIKLWQYMALLILLALAFVVHTIFWRALGFVLNIVANTRLGRGHFDQSIVQRLARFISYLAVAYFLYMLLPTIMLPVSVTHYIFGGIRILNTVFVIFLLLSCVDLGRSYFEKVVAETETDTDDQLFPIIIRTLKTIVILGGFMQILSLLGVDVRALIAGLSIGGLALALAAQETVKDLIGSVMIYADKPFKLGDFIQTDGITGTVEDIGFRSTRIRTLESSLIAVPNGSLVDKVIDNYGELRRRRFNTNIGIAYYTPPALIEKFVEGLKQMNQDYPYTDSENFYIHLNNMGSSSLDVLFVVFFETADFGEALKRKEELLVNILKLAELMQIHIAFPSTSVYVESMPERKGQMPDYSATELAQASTDMEDFLQKFKKQTNKNIEEEDIDEEDINRIDSEGDGL